MKKLIYTILIILGTLHVSAQETAKQIFTAPNLTATLSTHKNVAIVPFRVTIGYKRMPKGFDAEGNKQEEEKSGFNLQQGMYTYLLRRSSDYFVSFQDVERTNALLRKAGVIDKIDETLPDELCKILGVDAVIKCTYAYEKTGSEAGSIAVAALFGVASKTGSGNLTMQINNGTDGALLWRFYKEMNETAFSSGNELMERMMRKVSRNFPYMK